MPASLLVLGSASRIGRNLGAVWRRAAPGGLMPVWHARQGGDLAWDMLAQPFPGGIAPGGVVLNLAGVTDARAPMENNVTLALAACRAAAEAGARHVFLLSSAAVYGAAAAHDMAEDDAVQPLNPYGHAKRHMELCALDWAADAKTPVTILRLGNVAGADALLGRAGLAWAGQKMSIDPVPGHPGGPVRSYIGSRSLADVLAGLASLALTGAELPSIVNIAAGPPVTMGSLLDAAGITWVYGPENPAVIPRVGLNTRRMQRLFPLAAEAALPATMVAEWREVGV